ncbi:hypothetical protein SHK09_15020 [Polaribacter sp. PL03]|uniref:hypothetical protein n=1 Tax=Polaribacter sp. PL03 TaxID=3088353 RepID=UPI0029D2F5E5|nr:hypothetical protein [Polaribacter sp. PL03]MDX6748107.1 hypothetical protein [Polaribacter sp. PL03]
MTASNLKGSLLEYTVRRILLNCGFTKVKPDGLLIYKRGGLTMINGKGAAHDADVLMNPPIQMPFSYPYRLNFECKAYNKKVGLTIIRNALGLRYDINEFEIVTRKHLKERQNNKRSPLAIDNRQRFNYQVGVASVEDFTKPAFEFAANNKIPLISLRWFLPAAICDSFHQITPTYLQRYTEQQLNDLYEFLKGNDNENATSFLTETDSIFKNIYDSIIEFENRVLIGLLESGDLLFLISNNDNGVDYISNRNSVMTARFHYHRRTLDFWKLNVNQQVEFGFYLPSRIIEMWKEQSFDSQAAINLKAELFSRVFVFVKNQELPFKILKIDSRWLNDINQNE